MTSELEQQYEELKSRVEARKQAEEKAALEEREVHRLARVLAQQRADAIDAAERERERQFLATLDHEPSQLFIKHGDEYIPVGPYTTDANRVAKFAAQHPKTKRWKFARYGPTVEDLYGSNSEFIEKFCPLPK